MNWKQLLAMAIITALVVGVVVYLGLNLMEWIRGIHP